MSKDGGASPTLVYSNLPDKVLSGIQAWEMMPSNPY